jgi:hypothetical protein
MQIVFHTVFVSFQHRVSAFQVHRLSGIGCAPRNLVAAEVLFCEAGYGDCFCIPEFVCDCIGGDPEAGDASQ